MGRPAAVGLTILVYAMVLGYTIAFCATIKTVAICYWSGAQEFVPDVGYYYSQDSESNARLHKVFWPMGWLLEFTGRAVFLPAGLGVHEAESHAACGRGNFGGQACSGTEIPDLPCCLASLRRQPPKKAETSHVVLGRRHASGTIDSETCFAMILLLGFLASCAVSANHERQTSRSELRTGLLMLMLVVACCVPLSAVMAEIWRRSLGFACTTGFARALGVALVPLPLWLAAGYCWLGLCSRGVRVDGSRGEAMRMLSGTWHMYVLAWPCAISWPFIILWVERHIAIEVEAGMGVLIFALCGVPALLFVTGIMGYLRVLGCWRKAIVRG